MYILKPHVTMFSARNLLPKYKKPSRFFPLKGQNIILQNNEVKYFMLH